MPRTIILVGARGGSGTSTVAAALACLAATETKVRLASHDPIAMAHILAVPAPLAGVPVSAGPNLTLAVDTDEKEAVPSELNIVDAGTLTSASGDGNEEARYVVVRGPCYLALATLVARTDRNFGGVVLLAEPGRAMTPGHVAEVTGLPVVASVPVHARVARCLDAGVLASRADQLPELGELKALAGLQIDLHRTAVGRHCGIRATPVPSADRTASWEATR